MSGTAVKFCVFVQFRFMLPLILLASAAVRYNTMSFIYLLCLLITPLLRFPSRKSMNGLTGMFLKTLILVTLLPLLGHIIFQFIFMTYSDEARGTNPALLVNCSPTERVLRQIGFQRLDFAYIWDILRLILPDVVMFFTSIITFALSAKMKDVQVDSSIVTSETPLLDTEIRNNHRHLKRMLWEYLEAAVMLAAGACVPSVLAGVYFLLFLLLLTLWGCYRTVTGTRLAWLRIFLLIFTGSHILMLHLYQFQLLQDTLPPNTLLAGILGMIAVIQTRCSDVSHIYFYPTVLWTELLHPAILLVFYWILAINTNRWIRWRKLPFEGGSLPAEVMKTVSQESVAAESKIMYKRKPWMTFALLIAKNSHMCCLTAMMVWSIAYQSWFTFVLLVVACLLWILPNNRLVTLTFCPLIVLYAELILIGQYIFYMRLTDVLLSKMLDFNLSEIRINGIHYPFPNLLLQTTLCGLIILTFREYFHENQLKRDPSTAKAILEILAPWEEQYDSYDSSAMQNLGTFLWRLLCKVWILLCVTMMAFIALQDIVIYRLVYMILFLLFIIVFCFSFRVWRMISYPYLWAVLFYSIFILTALYAYQFKFFNELLMDHSGLNETLLMDLGFEKFTHDTEFENLLTPTIFVVVLILQLRYFHAPFLEFSDINRYKYTETDTNERKTESFTKEPNVEVITNDMYTQNTSIIINKQDMQDRIMKHWLRKELESFLVACNNIAKFLWRLGEIHVFKILTLAVMLATVYQVSVVTAFYVLILALLLPIPRSQTVLSRLVLLLTSLIILSKMIFQLRQINGYTLMTYCSEPENETLDVLMVNDAKWLGFIKVEENGIRLAEYVRPFMIIIALLVIESIIIYHQEQYFNKPTERRPRRGILFVKISRVYADRELKYCIMFFANYFFYKFGLECCYIMTAIVVCVRVDAVALSYILMAGCLMQMSRAMVARLWNIYKVILAIMLAVQYLLVLGVPMGACVNYPWMGDLGLPLNLRKWLYLPAYTDPPSPYKLIADFLQLLFVSLQAFVFYIEKDLGRMDAFGGGDNSDILEDVENHLPIPYSDFTLEQKTSIQAVKHLVFENLYWVTMAVIFITGTTRINIFSFFYVAAVFIFMWYGKEFYLKPLRALLRIWNYMICYCVLVLFFKTGLQLVGCVYVDILIINHQCWVVQLFGVNCLLSGSHKESQWTVCEIDEDSDGLAWDVICLTFLLMQRRVYSSHYFRHVVDTIHAQSSLVSKGAEIINRILIRRVLKQNEREKETLMNIKQQMGELKIRQAMLKKNHIEPEEHFQAIRAGDYYLLENVDQEKRISEEDTTIPASKMDLEMADADAVSTEVDVGSVLYYCQNNSMVPIEPPEIEPKSVSRIRNALGLLMELWLGFIDWLIHWFNNLSHDYRLVSRRLSKELILEKEKIMMYRRERRIGAPLILNRLKLRREDINLLPDDSRSYSLLSLDDLEKQDEEEIRLQFEGKSQRFSRLIVSGGLVLASQSELLCYFLMILNQMVYGSLLSMPLPLFVFLWGMLSVPRPSKTFWITAITYTESVVICKYFYQFGFFPWNHGSNRDTPFFPPRIMGIERSDHYADIDIAVLLALFLHRSILRRYGLWRDAADITADMLAAGIKENPFSVGEYDVMSHQYAGNGDEYIFDDSHSFSDSTDFKSKLRQGFSFILKPFVTFFNGITHSKYSATTDVYGPMFFCDFIIFLVLVFGFSSFGPAATTGDEDVTSYLRESKIPIPFLVMLITQFVLILVDRAIYLRRNVFAKFIFQILLVFIIHIWMFFILPATTERSFISNRVAQVAYLIKCLYFALSAHQIRSGYPNRILGNCLTRNYGFTNLILYKGFLAIPFLLELRAVMDWMWTDSSMAIGNWLQMEDVFTNIFVAKCWREFEKSHPQPRANKKRALVKYLAGGALVLVIIFIIWSPLVFFTFLYGVYIPSPPHEAEMIVGIGGYQPIFIARARGDQIRPFNARDYSLLRSHYQRDRNAFSFISGYGPDDLTLVEFDGLSASVWGITPTSKQVLLADLLDVYNRKLSLTIKVRFLRGTDRIQVAEVKNMFEVNLRQPASLNAQVIRQLVDVINETSSNPIEIFEVFPRYLRLTSGPDAVILERLLKGICGIGYSNISLNFMHMPELDHSSDSWNMNETFLGTSSIVYDVHSKPFSVNKISIITFNDKRTPSSWSYLAGLSIFRGGVMVMYVSFVLVVFKFVRVSFITSRMLYIQYEEAPNLDILLQIIDDMKLAREMKDYWLEEEIFAKLIFILRCPDVFFHMTRMQEVVPTPRQALTLPSPSTHQTRMTQSPSFLGENPNNLSQLNRSRPNL